jgi:hypothetical protein
LFFNLSYGGPWPVLKTILEITISFSILIISFFFLITTLFLINFLNNYLSPFYLSIRPSVWSSIHLVMVCLLGRGKERVEYRRSTVGKVKDVVKHHFIHLSHHSSIHPSRHPSIPSWSVYSNGVEKEWNIDAT